MAGRVSPRRATHFLLLRQKKVSKEKASPLPTTLRFRCGQPDSGASTGARQNSTSSPRALRSNNCRESDVEVLSGTCRSKPPDEPPESGVARRAGSGAGSDTALCFARVRFHPLPGPLPQAGEGARSDAARCLFLAPSLPLVGERTGVRGCSIRVQHRPAKQRELQCKTHAPHRPHLAKSRDAARATRSAVPSSYENSDSRRLSERSAYGAKLSSAA